MLSDIVHKMNKRGKISVRISSLSKPDHADASNDGQDGEPPCATRHARTARRLLSGIAFATPLNATASAQIPVELYRSVLARAENQSLNIISIGFLTNIAELLRSGPDSTSSMSGLELVLSRVRELIIMGGQYPSGWEYNFGGSDPESTQYVLSHWPPSIPVTYSGAELGGNVFSGQTLKSLAPPDSPVLAAYEWYAGRGGAIIRESWDPTTTSYGVLGLDGFAKLGLKSPFAYANENGYNSIILTNGSNAWVNDTTVTNQHWLRLADGVTNSSVAWMLDELYVSDPLQRACFGY